MKNLAFFLALFALFVHSHHDANAQNQAEKPLIVMGYYPSYNQQIKPDEIRADRFTDVIYSFATANAAGELDAASCANFPEFVRIVHTKNARAILALSGGGNGDNFAVMARDDEKRARFVAAIGELLKATKADGLSLDWEHPAPADKAIVTQLVRQLRGAVKAANPDGTLIIAVASDAWNGRGTDGPALRDLVDYLQIMSYDFHGEWNHAGHHTNLFADSSHADEENFSYPTALRYWSETQGLPADKILMGIAGYGRGFRAPNWGDKVTGESRYPSVAYAGIDGLIAQGWTRHWAERAGAPWLLSADKSERISYDDERSVAEKAAWMKRQNLAGFFIWEMTQEEVGGDNVLTKAALQGWRRAPAN